MLKLLNPSIKIKIFQANLLLFLVAAKPGFPASSLGACVFVHAGV